jgi:hypothetical protein
MREDKGRVGRFSDRRFAEKVEVLGPGIALDDLRSAITTRCVYQFGRPWDEHLGELKAFKEKNGHCRVPQKSSLGYFVADTRKDRKAGKLSSEQIQRLDEAGFVWDDLEAGWEERIEQLTEFKKQHSHCNVSSKWPDKHLASWVSNLRTKYRQGKIDPGRVRQLAEIGFSWDRPTEAWDEMFRTLLAYKELHGDCNVPVGWAPNKKLEWWVATQRKDYWAHSLNAGRIRQLEEAGFVWQTTNTSEWERHYSELAAYRQANGNCLVATQTELGRWVNTQQQAFATDRLSTERHDRLEQLGFEWNGRPRFAANWEEGFAMLLQYRDEYGSCDAPQKHPNHRRLGVWISNQRTKFRKGRLNEDQVRRLEAIGFKWKA